MKELEPVLRAAAKNLEARLELSPNEISKEGQIRIPTLNKVNVEGCVTDRINECFSKIEPEDRSHFRDTLLKYYSFEHTQYKIDASNEELFYFTNGYFSVYHELAMVVGERKRRLFVDGTRSMVNIAKEKNPLQKLFLLWRVLLSKKHPIPEEYISAFVDSLDHLRVKKKGNVLDERLKDYTNLAAEQFGKDPHPSQLQIFGFIRSKNDIVGIESFLFDLARYQSLNEKEIVTYYNCLKRLKVSERESLSNIRKKIKQEYFGSFDRKLRLDLDKNLYDLMDKTTDEDLRSHLPPFLLNFLRNSKKKSGEILNGLVSTLDSLVDNGMDFSDSGLDCERIFYANSPTLILPYFKVLDYIFKKTSDKKELDQYCRYSRSMLKDFSTDFASDTDKLYKVTIENVDRLRKLPDEDRTAVLDFVSTVLKELPKRIRIGIDPKDRAIRLSEKKERPVYEKAPSLYLPELTDIAINSVSVSREKAGSFLSSLMSYGGKVGTE